MKQSVCYLVSDVNESNQLNALFQAISQIEYTVSLIFIGEKIQKIYNLFDSKGYQVKFIKCTGKADMLSAFFQLYRILGEIKPDVIHTHLLKAAILGMPAAKLRGIKKRVQTRHHSNEMHMYHPHAVRYDKFINRLSLHIIAISNNVFKVLTQDEGVNLNKISIIHHGFNFEDFVTNPSTVSSLKEKYQLNGDFPVIGAISRFEHGKGLQYTIPAFKDLLQKYPNAKLVLANAKGNYKEDILTLLKELDE